MKSASPRKTRPSSPTKMAGGSINPSQEILNQMNTENQGLQFQLGERDVEIERMKITLIALNEKLAVTNGIRLDCTQYKEYHLTSETERKTLQVKIDECCENIKSSQDLNDEQHEKLKKEIERLMSLLGDQKVYQ